MKSKVYTSINLPKFLRNKLKQCVQELKVDEIEILSVLCYKAGRFVCKEIHTFKVIEYQDRGKDYEITPVYLYTADHEYMHASRLACKVSKLLACAMALFLDEILEKGINKIEVAKLRKIQHSYKKKTYKIRNFIFKTAINDQFEEYAMKMRVKKT